MEEHVRKQLANVATKPESDQKPESEKLPPTELPDVKMDSMPDLIAAIKSGDKAIENVLVELTRNLNQICESVTETHNRIANMEMCMEQLQLTNVTIFDKLAKIAMSLVVFVSKFGTKKNADQAKVEVEAEEDKS